MDQKLIDELKEEVQTKEQEIRNGTKSTFRSQIKGLTFAGVKTEQAKGMLDQLVGMGANWDRKLVEKLTKELKERTSEIGGALSPSSMEQEDLTHWTAFLVDLASSGPKECEAYAKQALQEAFLSFEKGQKSVQQK